MRYLLRIVAWLVDVGREPQACVRIKAALLPMPPALPVKSL
jgi:hypothetical protein